METKVKTEIKTEVETEIETEVKTEIKTEIKTEVDMIGKTHFRFPIAVLCLLMSALFLLACACGSGAGQSGGKENGGKENGGQTEQAAAELDQAFVPGIKDRGYLICGCKMDVPGLGFYEEETDTWSGLEIELAYSIAAKLFDVDAETAKSQALVHFEGVTVADREEKLQDGSIDIMIATFTITPERSKTYALSDSYYTDYIGLMVRKDQSDANSLGSDAIKSIADLDGRSVAVAKNSTTREHMLNYLNTMNSIKVHPLFMEYSSYDKMFAALKEGTVDVMSVDVSILNGYLDHNTTILGDRFASQHYGAAVMAEHGELIDIVNEVIAEF